VSNCKWFCPYCNESVEKNLDTSRQIEEKCKEFFDQYSRKLEDLRVELESKLDIEKGEELEARLEDKCSKEEVKEIIKEQLNKKEIKDIIAVGATGGAREEEIYSQETVIEETVKELKEKKKRENNLIIYNIPESQNEEKTERVKDDIKHIEKLMSILTVDCTDQTQGKPVRLGDQKMVDDGKTRPVLIRFKENKIKKDIFKNVKNLKETEEPYKSFAISNDLTLKERDKYKKLKEELKEKNEANTSGNTRFKIKGPPWNPVLVEVPKE
jgi:hypothetical protein